MIYNGNYSDQELIIFENVKKYFETLPPIDNDDYENSFYDLVAQFGGGGEEYMDAESLFTDLIEVQVEIAFKQLSEDDKKEITELYESFYFGEEYYQEDIEQYVYDTTDLSIYIARTFKSWIDDSFDQDYLYDYDEDEDDYHEEDITEYEENVSSVLGTLKVGDYGGVKSVKTEKKNTLLKQAFDLFVGQDELRPFMLKPFVFDGYIAASNGHKLIRIRKENCDFEFDATNKGPDMSGIVPDSNRYNVLQLEKEFFEKYKTKDEYADVIKDVKCNICNGDRVVEWSFEIYKKFSACPLCYGKDFLQEEAKEKTGKKLFNSQLIKIENLYFQIRYFYVLFEVQSLVGGEIVLISLGKSRGVFKIGDCEVLIMEQLYSPKDENEVIDITDRLK